MSRRFPAPLLPVLLAAALAVTAFDANAAPAAEPSSALAAQRNSRTEELRAADVQRIAALVSNDRDTLERLLADDLAYGHSDGRFETKADVLGGLLSGRQRYHAINPGDRTIRLLGEDHALISGTADLLVGPADAPFKLRVRYLAAYRRELRSGWQLLAYQSTRLPTEP